jgi:ribosomal protein S27E
MSENNNYEELICPHCQGFTLYDTTADEIICTICTQLITEEDLECIHQQ